MITLTTSKIEKEILNHFEDNLDLTEPKDSFECIFEFAGAEITVPYDFKHEVITYKHEWISAVKDGETFGIDDTIHFRIRTLSQNPNPKKRTMQQEVDSIIEHEERKQNENDDSLNICNDYKDHM